jgi:glycine oxidase
MACDVLIVGGGVIGLSIARSLAWAELRVTLLDRQTPGTEASWAGAGILPPAHLGGPGDSLSAMTRDTHALWPNLSAELLETTGIDNGFRRCGGIRVLHNSSGATELTFRGPDDSRPGESVHDWLAAGTAAVLLDGSELRRLEPQLSPSITSAIHLPEVCQVRNPWHLRALLADCERLGVDLRADRAVSGIQRRGVRVTGVATAEGTLTAGRVVIASGAWSTVLLPPELRPVAIEPVRGQIVLLRQSRTTLRRVIECGHRYLVPREDGRVLIGSTEERVGFEKRTTPEGIEGLLRFAGGLVPELRSAEREREWCGLRPYAAGGVPYIGPVAGCDGLYLAAGHFRAGLHLSPLTARIIRDQVLGVG